MVLIRFGAIFVEKGWHRKRGHRFTRCLFLYQDEYQMCYWYSFYSRFFYYWIQQFISCQKSDTVILQMSKLFGLRIIEIFDLFNIHHHKTPCMLSFINPYGKITNRYLKEGSCPVTCFQKMNDWHWYLEHLNVFNLPTSIDIQFIGSHSYSKYLLFCTT